MISVHIQNCIPVVKSIFYMLLAIWDEAGTIHIYSHYLKVEEQKGNLSHFPLF